MGVTATALRTQFLESNSSFRADQKLYSIGDGRESLLLPPRGDYVEGKARSRNISLRSDPGICCRAAYSTV